MNLYYIFYSNYINSNILFQIMFKQIQVKTTLWADLALLGCDSYCIFNSLSLFHGFPLFSVENRHNYRQRYHEPLLYTSFSFSSYQLMANLVSSAFLPTYSHPVSF